MIPENIEESKVRGYKAQRIVEQDLFQFLNIQYTDCADDRTYQIMGLDLNTIIGKVEVKGSYRDDEHIIIEEWWNCNPGYGPCREGWWKSTQADTIVFVSPKTRTHIILSMTPETRTRFEAVKNNYPEIRNSPSIADGGKCWQSSYRRIPLSVFCGLYAVYQKPV